MEGVTLSIQSHQDVLRVEELEKYGVMSYCIFTVTFFKLEFLKWNCKNSFLATVS